MAHAFISYSHSDEYVVTRLHTHMSQLKREGLLTSWFDGEILPGGSLDENIQDELTKADIFLAVVSPDYLNSAYCYDVEFQKALSRFATGKLKSFQSLLSPAIGNHPHSVNLKRFQRMVSQSANGLMKIMRF